MIWDVVVESADYCGILEEFRVEADTEIEALDSIDELEFKANYALDDGDELTIWAKLLD